MRDLVLLLVLVATAAWSLRRPWIGIIAWTVTSLGSPHVEFGFAARDWPVGLVISLATLLGMLASREKQNPLIGAPAWWLLAFSLWITLALPFSIYVEFSYPLWLRSAKIFLMTFVAMALLTDRRKLEVFIWANVLSIAFYGVKGGIFTIATGGHYRVWGPGGFIEGNNELALALISVVPLMRYVQTQLKDKRAIMGMTLAMGLCVASALGTYSRGAFLGLGAMGAFFWLKGRNKFLWATLIVTISLIGLSFMPEQWWDRMATIDTYQSDGSAMGRINAWWTAFYVAKDHFFGGGFMMWDRAVFARYAPNAEDVHAAHSIYFQALGEQGFVGLFLFLAIGASTWMTARRLSKLARTRDSLQWASDLGRMVQVSMIGYAVTGAFLSLTYFDLPYNVMVIAVLALRFVKAELAEQPAAAAVPLVREPMPNNISGKPRWTALR